MMPRLDDPDTMMDGRKDPGKAQARSIAARKAAETKKHRDGSLGLIPGSFPNEEELRANTPTLTDNLETGTLRSASIPQPLPQPLPSLALPAIGGQFEGPYAVLQPTEIAREMHEPVERLSAQPVQHDEVNEEMSHTWNPFPPGPVSRVDRASVSERSRHTSASRRSEESRRRDEDIRQLTEAVRELRKDNQAIRKDNLVLQEEIAKVRSGRSSLASVSHTGPIADVPVTKPMELTDTPLSKKWVDMDEIQFVESPRKILESILREKRNRRLTQAGLPSSDNTVVSPQIDRQEAYHEPVSPANSIRKFANLTFTRGNTLKRNEETVRPNMGKIPGGRIEYNDFPVIAVTRDLPRVTG